MKELLFLFKLHPGGHVRIPCLINGSCCHDHHHRHPLLPALLCSRSFCPLLARAREPWAGRSSLGEANWGCVTLNGAVPGCTLLCEGPITAARGVGETPLVAVTLTLHQLNASGTVSIQEFRHLWKQLMFYQVRTSVHTASHGME